MRPSQPPRLPADGGGGTARPPRYPGGLRLVVGGAPGELRAAGLPAADRKSGRARGATRAGESGAPTGAGSLSPPGAGSASPAGVGSISCEGVARSRPRAPPHSLPSQRKTGSKPLDGPRNRRIAVPRRMRTALCFAVASVEAGPARLLEEFRVYRDGATFPAVDFNFWGVTFAADGDRGARPGPHRAARRGPGGRVGKN